MSVAATKLRRWLTPAPGISPPLLVEVLLTLGLTLSKVNSRALWTTLPALSIKMRIRVYFPFSEGLSKGFTKVKVRLALPGWYCPSRRRIMQEGPAHDSLLCISQENSVSPVTEINLASSPPSSAPVTTIDSSGFVDKTALGNRRTWSSRLQRHPKHAVHSNLKLPLPVKTSFTSSSSTVTRIV